MVQDKSCQTDFKNPSIDHLFSRMYEADRSIRQLFGDDGKCDFEEYHFEIMYGSVIRVTSSYIVLSPYNALVLFCNCLKQHDIGHKKFELVLNEANNYELEWLCANIGQISRKGQNSLVFNY